MPDTSSPTSTSLNRQVLSLALPALGALIAEPLFVLADSAMVGHLGAVSLAGLSLASSILTTTVGLFVFLAYATTATTARLFGAGRRIEGLRASLGSGTPLLIRSLSLRVAILATVWAATALGDVSLAAHQVVNALWTFAAFALDALAVAAQALIGTALGQAQRSDADSATSDTEVDIAADTDTQSASATAGWSIDELLRRLLAWGAGTGVLIGVLMAAGAAWLPHVFTSDPGVITAATPTLLVAASALPLAGVVYLLDGVLMGAGDGRYLAWAGLLTLVPYVPLALLIGGGALPGVVGTVSGLVLLWIAFAWVFMAARGATTYLRSRGTAWRH